MRALIMFCTLFYPFWLTIGCFCLLCCLVAAMASQWERLREIEIANENRLEENDEIISGKNTKTPTASTAAAVAAMTEAHRAAQTEHRKNHAHMMTLFRASHARKNIIQFIDKLCNAVRGKQTIEYKQNGNNTVQAVLALIESIDAMIDEEKAHENSEQRGRFGRPAFRTFLANVEEKAETLLQHLLCLNEHAQQCQSEKVQNDSNVQNCSENKESKQQKKSHTDNQHMHVQQKDVSNQSTLMQLRAYFICSFGDVNRIDYGTGHELNFLCFLWCLHNLGIVKEEHFFELVCMIFHRYIVLMRRLQAVYWLEPAGSRGVWGLDDYCFLPFLFGSAQLIGQKYIKPKSVLSSEILDACSSQYMYLDALKFVMQVKSCSFAEHSPMLYDITIVKTWEQVHAGLRRMYEGEVLGKFAVIQHFIYSTFLPSTAIEQVDETVSPDHDNPCCSDIIHFPSSIAARSMDL